MVKTVVGYVEPLSVEPGEQVSLHVSCETPGRCEARLLRVLGVDHFVDTGLLEASFRGRRQEIESGSYAVVEPHPWLAELSTLSVSIVLWPTTPDEPGQMLFDSDSWSLELDRGAIVFTTRARDGRPGVSVRAEAHLLARHWYRVGVAVEVEHGEVVLAVRPLPASPFDPVDRADVVVRVGQGANSIATVAARGALGIAGEGFSGKLADLRLADQAHGVSELLSDLDDGGEARWPIRFDFANGTGTDRIVDSGPHGLSGHTVQHPARAMTDWRWDGERRDWTVTPEHFGAIHFHDDDIVDAGWEPDLLVDLPTDLDSGVYAIEVAQGSEVDRNVFFVRPPRAGPRRDVAFLVPTYSYLAYANATIFVRAGESLGVSRPRYEIEDYLVEHAEVGRSLYEIHRDKSGIAYSSRHRPILGLRPDAPPWQLPADLDVIAFFDHLDLPVDVITDEDLHIDGRGVLDGHRVVVTGTHPEYWSTEMLDALEEWLAGGGRLIYLGGNGFYWRIAVDRADSGLIEVRRAEGGTRAWEAEPGEYVQELDGRHGGMWRRNGRPPNRLVGVGFAAQGFGHGGRYRRTPASRDPRVDWLFDGVESADIFGDHGRDGGAAAEEIDRLDYSLGSPPHAMVLASSEGHSEYMLRVVEEFLMTMPLSDDPKVRSDLVFFEGPNGGAVLSTGSIGWASALADNDYDNDVARLTANAVRRFADAAPFEPPPGAASVS